MWLQWHDPIQTSVWIPPLLCPLETVILRPCNAFLKRENKLKVPLTVSWLFQRHGSIIICFNWFSRNLKVWEWNQSCCRDKCGVRAHTHTHKWECSYKCSVILLLSYKKKKLYYHSAYFFLPLYPPPFFFFLFCIYFVFHTEYIHGCFQYGLWSGYTTTNWEASIILILSGIVNVTIKILQ